QRAVWLSSDCINGKYLWALPTPTTFEKVDQTFIFGTETFSFAVLCYPTENQLNHNLAFLVKKKDRYHLKAVF
ncbi:hypothetical protein, partial [Ruminococcus sp.]|uniref:hypothetical protein n=1 Tax=Ruminococcus sp. TaxID=41978 RepID=UPI003F7F2A29